MRGKMPSSTTEIYALDVKLVAIRFIDGRQMHTRYRILCEDEEALKEIRETVKSNGATAKEMKEYENKEDVYIVSIEHHYFSSSKPFSIEVNKRLFDKDRVELFGIVNVQEAQKYVIGLDFSNKESK